MARYLPFVPTDEQRALVEKLTGLGVKQEHICSLVINPETKKGISLQILNRDFSEELDRGAARAVTKVAQNLYRIATSEDISGPVVTACIFYMKCRAHWREVQRVEHTGADGAPLDNAAIQTLEGKINRLAGQGGDTVVPFRTNSGGS